MRPEAVVFMVVSFVICAGGFAISLYFHMKGE